MTRCPKCTRELPYAPIQCPGCGAAVAGNAKPERSPAERARKQFQVNIGVGVFVLAAAVVFTVITIAGYMRIGPYKQAVSCSPTQAADAVTQSEDCVAHLKGTFENGASWQRKIMYIIPLGGSEFRSDVAFTGGQTLRAAISDDGAWTNGHEYDMTVWRQTITAINGTATADDPSQAASSNQPYAVGGGIVGACFVLIAIASKRNPEGRAAKFMS